MQIIKNTDSEKLMRFLAETALHDFAGSEFGDEAKATCAQFSSSPAEGTTYLISLSKMEDELSLLEQFLRGVGGCQSFVIIFPEDHDIIQAGIIVERLKKYSDLLLPPLLRASAVPSEDIWVIDFHLSSDQAGIAAEYTSIRQIFDQKIKKG